VITGQSEKQFDTKLIDDTAETAKLALGCFCSVENSIGVYRLKVTLSPGPTSVNLAPNVWTHANTFRCPVSERRDICLEPMVRQHPLHHQRIEFGKKLAKSAKIKRRI
jgi:hypothetical protein